MSHVWSNSSLLEIGPSSAARKREYVLCLSKVAICFSKMTVLMFVWCRAYGCRSVSVDLISPLFLSTGALVPLYQVSMDPSKDWLAASLSDFDSIGNR